MYQRNGRISPQNRANPFMAKIGNPTPAKLNAGAQKMPVMLSPSGRLSTSSWNRAVLGGKILFDAID